MPKITDKPFRPYNKMSPVEKCIFNFFAQGKGRDMIKGSISKRYYNPREIANFLYDYLDRNYFDKNYELN